jgi:radical SAM superfamily enzyme YgiQ (UPF0313 family)
MYNYVNMNESKKVVIISVPYCEPYPMVAPVLLSACLNQAGIPAVGIDFNAKFVAEFHNRLYYSNLKNFLCMGHLVNDQLDPGMFRDIYKFTKRFLQDIHREHNPEYVGLSIFTSESLDFGLVLSYMLRRYFPNTKILAGGKGLEVNHLDNIKHSQLWADNGIADLVIVGDAEAEVISSIREHKRGLVVSAPQTKSDLDQIPVPAWQNYDLDFYSQLAGTQDRQNQNSEPYMTITGSKGCVRKCTFCDVASFWPDFIYRDPIRVADEIIHNHRHTGIKKFHFTDNLINGSISNYRTMNQRLVEKIPGAIKYQGYAIFRGRSQMPDDDFKLAAAAGCELWQVGVESGSEKIRYDMKKKFDDQDLDWSVRALHRYGIAQSWLLIVGYPSETEADFELTKQMLRRYAHLAPNNMIQIGITPTFALLANSPLLTDPELTSQYGLDHHESSPLNEKFWVSTKYQDNDYPTRSRRWKELVALTQELGYAFQPYMPIEKFQKNIASLDEIYNDSKTKIFPIRSS